MNKLLLLPICFAMFLSGCNSTADIEKEMTAVSESFNQLINAFPGEDAEILENLICDDPEMVYFGTDAQERWIGKDDFIAAQKRFFGATSGSKMEIYNKTIKLSESGTVAWTSCMLNWDIESGDQPVHLEGLRMTILFEKRNNNWEVVQMHGSVPVSDQMIEY